MCDGLRNDFHGFLMAIDGSWYDEKSYPLFNNAQGVRAVDLMKELMKYAPPEVLTYFNDQAMVALQQGLVAMGNQWATRAAPIDRPDVSKVVGLMEFAPAPSGRLGGVPCTKLSADTYAIPRNINVDKDLVFRVIAEATDAESMKRADEFAFVPRRSVTTDPAMIQKYRFWPATVATIEAGAKTAPLKPWDSQVEEIVTLRVAQALAGEMGVKQALDTAAREVRGAAEGRRSPEVDRRLGVGLTPSVRCDRREWAPGPNHSLPPFSCGEAGGNPQERHRS